MVHKKDKLPINNLHLQKIGGKLTRTRKNTKYSFFFQGEEIGGNIISKKTESKQENVNFTPTICSFGTGMLFILRDFKILIFDRNYATLKS